MRPRLDGWLLTDHALKRALQRRLEPEEILEAINSPRTQIIKPTGKVERAGTTCTVVVVPESRTIITLF